MNEQAEAAVKAIVFDLDGTLVDSAPDLHAAVNRLLARSGRPTLALDQVKGMVGDGVAKLVERALAATGGVPASGDVEGLAQWVSRYLDEYEGHGTDLSRAFPGVTKTLARFYDAGILMAVCTNKPQTATMQVLKGLELASYFDAVIGGDALDGVRKPDPRHLLGVIEALGVDPAQAVMVGDHANDLACGRAAGTPVVLCAYGYSATPVGTLGADAVIERFEDLPAVIDRLA